MMIHYRRVGIGRPIHYPIKGHDQAHIVTPDDIMNGKRPTGDVVIYDDDHFYVGGVIAELLAQNGCKVSIVSPSPLISYWTQFTLEQEKIEKKLLALGVKFFERHTLTSIYQHDMMVEGTITGNETSLSARSVILVTDRTPNDGLYHDLKPFSDNGTLDSLRVIGDAEAPNTIAQAVSAGHLAAKEFAETIDPDETPFKVERVTDFHLNQ